MKARIIEIFSSLQGEGPFLGEKQIFVRFAGCNLRCSYCDEPDSLAPSSGSIMSLDDVRRLISDLQGKAFHKSVSLTGGEPLLHVEFLESLIPFIKQQGLQVYLETNGTLPEAVRRIRDGLDVVSMDIKLPSATGMDTWKEHGEFLSTVCGKSFVKVVVTEESKDDEIHRAVDLVSWVSPDIAFVIQPVTLYGGVKPPSPERIKNWLSYARSHLKDLRLIPQHHPAWNLP